MKTIIIIIILIVTVTKIHATEVPTRPQTGRGLQMQQYTNTYNSINDIIPIIKNARSTINIQSATITNNDLLSALIFKSKTCKINIILDVEAKSDNNLTSLFKTYNMAYRYDVKHKINSNYIIIDNSTIIVHSKYFANPSKNETTNTLAIYGNNQAGAAFIKEFNNHLSHSK